MIDTDKYPEVSRMIVMQLDVFPAHKGFIERRFTDVTQGHLEKLEEIAILIRQITGDGIAEFFEDYKWLTDEVLKEEIQFRRSGQYRLSSFEEAERTVYADPIYMRRYMNGLLLTQLWWKNHSQAVMFYRDTFLSQIVDGERILEIGPGHGLLLYLASRSNAGFVSGWDVSRTSLDHTRQALDAMKVTGSVSLECHNLFDAPTVEFDHITFSEVLEHLEQPLAALRVLRGLLPVGGRLYVHAPANSPAPDHLYLFRHPQEIVDMVGEAGFEVDQSAFYPGTGATLDRALKFKLAISAVLTAKAI